MNFNILRKLARSNKWQIVYNNAKELRLKLFNNDVDLSKLQIWFLYYLNIYSSLYTDLATQEDYISEEVILDDLRTEAYLLLRSEKRKKSKNTSLDKDNNTQTPSTVPTILFRKKTQ